jgi:hypothetical protein
MVAPSPGKAKAYFCYAKLNLSFSALSPVGGEGFPAAISVSICEECFKSINKL